jgi:hypothetical protein
MHLREMRRDGFYRPNPSLANRAQAFVAMLVFFTLLFGLLSGPAWLPLVVDKLVGR